MQTQTSTTDLVLVGGGHSHLSVIKQLGMHPLPGLRITVISRDIHTPYSGMLPGLIAGHYQHGDIHIDLRPLCQFAKARLFHSEVTHIDMEQQLIYCHNRPPVRFDWLSVNTGSVPNLTSIEGAHQVGIAVKPIDTFLQHWQHVITSIKKNPREMSIAIVGGGAASIEVILAVQYQLQHALGSKANGLQFELLCAASTLLPNHNPRVQQFISQTLLDRGINVRTQCSVLSAQTHPSLPQQKLLQLSTAQSFVCDELIWAIHAGSPDWVRETGIACDASGFIKVNQSLQSLSHPMVFAAGDIAHFSSQPLAKSGVYAVRAGKILAKNLRRVIQGKRLIAYRPQRHFLSLLMTGNQYAIASKGLLSISGRWVWQIKNSIDKKFIDTFSQLPLMPSPAQPQPLLSSPNAPTPPVSQHSPMRCGGCGAKISQRILTRVMATLKPLHSPDVIIGLNAPDDAAVIAPPTDKQWVQTIDYFRAFIDDPYLLARIATHHCLSDIYAMGAKPHSALVIATVPYASEPVIEDSLLQLMSGAIQTLNEQNTVLIGGHSSEGAELGFGLSVNGVIDPQRLLTKGKLEHGQQLILTKPLGTGTLFAANMLGNAKGYWIEQALQHMLISNRLAAQIIHQYGATACTDITGFGLLGHLLEMLRMANLGAQLKLHALPLLNGALHCANNGWLSSLHPDNIQAQHSLVNNASFVNDRYYPLLFDPQTAGGLLASIPAVNADLCVTALRQADCPQAVVIGDIDASLTGAVVSLR